MLGAHIHSVRVRRVDLVNDTTNVEVRFEVLNQDTVPGWDGRGQHELLPETPGAGS